MRDDQAIWKYASERLNASDAFSAALAALADDVYATAPATLALRLRSASFNFDAVSMYTHTGIHFMGTAKTP